MLRHNTVIRIRGQRGANTPDSLAIEESGTEEREKARRDGELDVGMCCDASGDSAELIDTEIEGASEYTWLFVCR